MEIESKTCPIESRISNVCVTIIVLALISALISGTSYAADKPVPKSGTGETQNNAKKAKGLLNRAVAYYKANGDRAFAAFNRQGEFILGELYVYALNTSGVMLASGGTSSVLIDHNVLGKSDVDGKLLFKEMLDIAKSKDSGSVEYRWLNRVDRKVERKLTYFEKVGDVIIAVGYYIPHASAEQAKALLNKAADSVKNDPKNAFKTFNDISANFIEDDLYVFVIDMNNKVFYANGAYPRLIGTNAQTLTDPNGKLIFKDLPSLVDVNGQGELDYAWRNSVTNKIEKKHTFLRKVDNYLVGVGYYIR